MRNIWVGGINGTGKTTVLHALPATANVMVVSASGALMEWLGIPGDYQALRRRTQRDNRRALDKLLQTRLRQSSGQAYIFDGHFLNLRRGRLSASVMARSLARFDGLVLVESEVQVVERRLLTDGFDRGLFPKHVSEGEISKRLADFARAERAQFLSMERALRLPSVVINHSDGNLTDCAKVLLEFVVS